MVDYVSKLNQHLQMMGHLDPSSVLEETNRSRVGEDHTPMWSITLRVRVLDIEGTGTGSTVKEAKKEAAFQLYKVLTSTGSTWKRSAYSPSDMSIDEPEESMRALGFPRSSLGTVTQVAPRVAPRIAYPAESTLSPAWPAPTGGNGSIPGAVPSTKSLPSALYTPATFTGAQSPAHSVGHVAPTPASSASTLTSGAAASGAIRTAQASSARAIADDASAIAAAFARYSGMSIKEAKLTAATGDALIVLAARIAMLHATAPHDGAVKDAQRIELLARRFDRLASGGIREVAGCGAEEDREKAMAMQVATWALFGDATNGSLECALRVLKFTGMVEASAASATAPDAYDPSAVWPDAHAASAPRALGLSAH